MGKIGKVASGDVIFPDPINMGWPARDHWPRLLWAVHFWLDKAAHNTYGDKDIMVPSNFTFEARRDSRYQRLESFDVKLVRLNERYASHESFDLREVDYRITLLWGYGENVDGFEWCRIKAD